MASKAINIIKSFPRLYTLDSKKKVRIFDCKVVDDIVSSELTEFNSTSYYTITSTGLLDGKLIEQKELVKEGKNKGKKNETNPLDQALLQADSLWREKLDSGYKSHSMLTAKLVSILGGQLIYEEFVLSLAIKNCPEFAYTNSNWDELPMLAHPVKKVKNLKFPYLGQPKLNGVRCLSKLTINREYNIPSGPVKLMSRGGTYYQVSHIQKQLMELFSLLICNGFSEDLMFDGELYKHGVPLQEISGASRKEESGLFTSNSWLDYHIYDVIDLNKPNQTQKERNELFSLIYNIGVVQQHNNLFPNIKFVDSILLYNKSEIELEHNSLIKEGYEGLILRDLLSSYKFNERSYGLLKVKEFQDEEFEIIGCDIDPSKTIEESFVFILLNNKGEATMNGKLNTFKARPTGTEAMKKKWFYLHMNSDFFRGKWATVRFFERSNEGIPTMGHVRHKDTPCLLEHIRPNGE